MPEDNIAPPGSVKADEYARSFAGQVGSYAVSPVHLAAARALSAKPGTRVLDVGCGEGELCTVLAEQGAAPVGVDYVPEAIAAAKARVLGASFQVAEATALPFESASFDAVVALGLIGYLSPEDQAKFVAECRRVLTPGGKLLLRVSPPANATGQRILATLGRGQGSKAHRFSRSELKNLLASGGFKVERSWLSLDRGGFNLSDLPLLLLFPFFAQRWILARS